MTWMEPAPFGRERTLRRDLSSATMSEHGSRDDPCCSDE